MKNMGLCLFMNDHKNYKFLICVCCFFFSLPPDLLFQARWATSQSRARSRAQLLTRPSLPWAHSLAFWARQEWAARDSGRAFHNRPRTHFDPEALGLHSCECQARPGDHPWHLPAVWTCPLCTRGHLPDPCRSHRCKFQQGQGRFRSSWTELLLSWLTLCGGHWKNSSGSFRVRDHLKPPSKQCRYECYSIITFKRNSKRNSKRNL